MTTLTRLHGGCLCGKYRYQTNAAPFASDYCHCSQCRKSSGAAVAVWMDFKQDEITWANDAPKEYASSEFARRGFCDSCGCTLSYRDTRHSEYFSLSVPTLDKPERVKPTYHIHTSSAVPWMKIEDDLPRHAEGQSSDA